MGAIREELYLADKFSGTFKNFDAAANASIDTAKAFQDALNDFTSGFMDGLQQSLNASRDELADMVSETQRAADAQDRLANEATSTGRAVKDAEEKQEEYTAEVKRSESAAGSLIGTVSKIAGAIGVAKLTKDFLATSDEMTQIAAKLRLINDGSQTTEDLQRAIYNSAERARGSYTDTATLVARLGMNAKSAFKSNEEMIAFAENLNKSFKIAGASAQEQSSVILQMSQALASGVLRGQEFNAVMSGAPNVMQNVAEYLHVSVGSLREMAAEGQISADVVKNALLAATDTINEQFNTIPITFSDVMTSAKNKLVDGLTKAFDEWTRKLNDKGIKGSIDNITDAITNLATIGADALLGVANIVNDLAANWSVIEPIIIAVGTAIVAFKVLNIIQAAEVGAAWATAFGGLPLLIGGAVGLVSQLGDSFGDFETTSVTSVGAVEQSVKDLDKTFEDFGNSAADNVNAIGDALEPVKEGASELNKFIGQVTADFNYLLDHSLILSHFKRLIDSTFPFFNGKTADEIANEKALNEQAAKYGVTFEPGDTMQDKRNKVSEALNKQLQREKTLQDGVWYNQYYGRDTGAHINPEVWSQPWYGYQDELFATMVAEHNANLKREQEEAADKSPKPVVVVNEVKLADEDLKMFRDIAEWRYMTNVNLETLAPNISVSVEGGASLTADEIAAAVAEVLVEQRAERTAIAH